ncbi:MAG: hypothetical protein ACTHZ1_02975 [Sphingobacterium sp.]
MVENSTKTKELHDEGQHADSIQEDDTAKLFEDKLKSCIQQLSKDPNDKTLEKILNYSKTLRNF